MTLTFQIRHVALFHYFFLLFRNTFMHIQDDFRTKRIINAIIAGKSRLKNFITSGRGRFLKSLQKDFHLITFQIIYLLWAFV